ncbi:Arp2/3 complex subunit, actin nucleation center [Lambiella insularis]|nr:Arp2/3 complex subunit, actin nucleation center [Lambiella insularis]
MAAENGTTVMDDTTQASGTTGIAEAAREGVPSTQETYEPAAKEDEVPATNGTHEVKEAAALPTTNGADIPAYHPLKGKVALVTGAGRGIGAGIAMELAKKGASIVVHYSSSSATAADVVKSLEATGVRAVAIKAELTRLEEIESLFQQAAEHFGRLDIVASNSGKEKFCPLSQTTLEDYNEIFDLNTRAQFFVAKAAFQYLSPGGRLVLMSSIAAGIGVPGHSLYAGSKSAVEGFTRCFAADFGSKGCTVNAIAPAGVKSDMWSQNSWRYAPGCDKTSSIEQVEEALANGSPLKRCAVPADIGRVVAFLASPEGEWINGQIIPLNGGARV